MGKPGGRIEVEKADDNSFIISIYIPSESMGCECIKLTAKDERALIKSFPGYIKQAFEGVKDEFDEAFNEKESPSGYIEVSIEKLPKVIKDVDDTPLEQMTPTMKEKHKGKMIKE